MLSELIEWTLNSMEYACQNCMSILTQILAMACQNCMHILMRVVAMAEVPISMVKMATVLILMIVILNCNNDRENDEQCFITLALSLPPPPPSLPPFPLSPPPSLPSPPPVRTDPYFKNVPYPIPPYLRQQPRCTDIVELPYSMAGMWVDIQSCICIHYSTKCSRRKSFEDLQFF